MFQKLVHRTNNISNAVNLQIKLVHLRNIFKKNWYTARQIHRAFHPRRRPSETGNKQKPNSTAFLPFVKKI
jgi:hypothetical protein